jgi:hypothetical protein
MQFWSFKNLIQTLIVFLYFSKIVSMQLVIFIFNKDIFVKDVQVPPINWFEFFLAWVKSIRNAQNEKDQKRCYPSCILLQFKTSIQVSWIEKKVIVLSKF